MTKASVVAVSVICLTASVPKLFDSKTLAAESSSEDPIGRAVTYRGQAAEATRNATIEHQGELDRKMQLDLAAIQAEVRAWQEKADALSDEARADLQHAIRRVEMKKDLAKRQLEDLRRTTTTAWIRWQEGMVQALDELKRACREAAAALP